MFTYCLFIISTVSSYILHILHLLYIIIVKIILSLRLDAYISLRVRHTVNLFYF